MTNSRPRDTTTLLLTLFEGGLHSHCTKRKTTNVNGWISDYSTREINKKWRQCLHTCTCIIIYICHSYSAQLLCFKSISLNRIWLAYMIWAAQIMRYGPRVENGHLILDTWREIGLSRCSRRCFIGPIILQVFYILKIHAIWQGIAQYNLYLSGRRTQTILIEINYSWYSHSQAGPVQR